jgi:molybdopterin-binding protein
LRRGGPQAPDRFTPHASQRLDHASKFDRDAPLPNRVWQAQARASPPSPERKPQSYGDERQLEAGTNLAYLNVCASGPTEAGSKGDAGMKLSARNVFKGKVLDVKVGPIASKVRVDIGGGNVVTSTITADAVDDLGIAVGDEISVIIKSSSVMLGK